MVHYLHGWPDFARNCHCGGSTFLSVLCLIPAYLCSSAANHIFCASHMPALPASGASHTSLGEALTDRRFRSQRPAPARLALQCFPPLPANNRKGKRSPVGTDAQPLDFGPARFAPAHLPRHIAVSFPAVVVLSQLLHDHRTTLYRADAMHNLHNVHNEK